MHVHDDVITWWFPHCWSFVRGILTVDTPHKGSLTRELTFYLMLAKLHFMGTLSALLACCGGNPFVTVDSRHNRPVMTEYQKVSREEGKGITKRTKGTGVVCFARFWSLLLVLFPTWTVGAETSPGENIISNKEDLQHASNDKLLSQWYADIDLVSCWLCAFKFWFIQKAHIIRKCRKKYIGMACSPLILPNFQQCCFRLTDCRPHSIH